MSRYIEHDECLICFKSVLRGISLMRILNNDQLCYACRQHLKLKLKSQLFHGVKLYTLYEYDKDSSQYLVRFKDYGDTALAPIFLSPIKILLKILFRKDTLVFVPSSKQMLEYRGFHHLELMVEGLNMNVEHDLEKTNEIQRFSKSRTVHFKRVTSKKYKNVILFDDVITSGNSLHAAVKLLKPACERLIIVCLFNNYKGGE